MRVWCACVWCECVFDTSVFYDFSCGRVCCVWIFCVWYSARVFNARVFMFDESVFMFEARVFDACACACLFRVEFCCEWFFVFGFLVLEFFRVWLSSVSVLLVCVCVPELRDFRHGWGWDAKNILRTKYKMRSIIRLKLLWTYCEPSMWRIENHIMKHTFDNRWTYLWHNVEHIIKHAFDNGWTYLWHIVEHIIQGNNE